MLLKALRRRLNRFKGVFKIETKKYLTFLGKVLKLIIILILELWIKRHSNFFDILNLLYTHLKLA